MLIARSAHLEAISASKPRSRSSRLRLRRKCQIQELTLQELLSHALNIVLEQFHAVSCLPLGDGSCHDCTENADAIRNGYRSGLSTSFSDKIKHNQVQYQLLSWNVPRYAVRTRRNQLPASYCIRRSSRCRLLILLRAYKYPGEYRLFGCLAFRLQ